MEKVWSIIWNSTKNFGRNNELKLLEKLKKLTRDLAVIRQQLELELSSALLE